MKSVMKLGTRSSRLAQVQTGNALRALGECFPAVVFEAVPVSSPGDRDLRTDLRESPDDFFTRDLDEMVLAGELDGAVHSAKDVPDPVREGLDWFWLPWREDPRDVVIAPAGQTFSHPRNLSHRLWSVTPQMPVSCCIYSILCGQIATHAPQPVHSLLSIFTT